MIDKKQIKVINKILKQYGIEQTSNETMVSVYDSLMLYNKNIELFNLFEKYDRGELSEGDIKINLNSPVLKKIEEHKIHLERA